MANPEHLAILKQGVEAWNKWRRENPTIKPDLSETDLIGMNLRGVNFRKTQLSLGNLQRANLTGADLSKAKLKRTILKKTILTGADLSGARLCGADLSDAHLFRADLSEADLTGADLSYAQLETATLVLTKLNRAKLTGCKIFGISAWDLELEEAVQKNLIISVDAEPTITVDNLEVAQFINLLLNRKKIRNFIDTITSKVVLILGRFTDERKAVLDAIRDALRKRNYTPVLFDFDKPASRDLTETISTLAHMARFIIADITEPRCIPHELATIVPTLSVPVKPLLLKGATGEYAMFRDLSKYPWVMTIYRYKNSDELIQSLEAKVIAPAEKKAKALIKSKNR